METYRRNAALPPLGLSPKCRRSRVWNPQEQANKWVKNMEKENGLKVVTLKQSDYLRTLENAIAFRQPVLMQEVMEELDPSLEPIMSKAVIKVGNRNVMKLGDKEVDLGP